MVDTEVLTNNFSFQGIHNLKGGLYATWKTIQETNGVGRTCPAWFFQYQTDGCTARSGSWQETTIRDLLLLALITARAVQIQTALTSQSDALELVVAANEAATTKKVT
jgi:hypothetical protein